uniref:hypothetical protein n=1 Tax=Helicobacter pylori TaxID=210 RepID=UPI0039FD528B
PPPFNTNTALILSRQAKAIGEFDAVFISKEASDLNIYYGGGGLAFPLRFACEWIGESCVFVVSFRLKMSE